MQRNPSSESSEVSRGERLVVLWLAITFFLCVFVSIPKAFTSPVEPLRRAARSYLRSCGVDQYWPMFVGEDWDIPQLRITATNASGVRSDVTRLFLHQGPLYRHILDDHVLLLHFSLARGDKPSILASYARCLRDRLGPGIREIHFEAVYSTARPGVVRGNKAPGWGVPLATYRWE